jgi:hypothetical protein
VSGSHQLTYTAGAAELELNDLDADPGQETNLAEREPALTERLRGVLMSTMGVVEVRDDEREALHELGYVE